MASVGIELSKHFPVAVRPIFNRSAHRPPVKIPMFSMNLLTNSQRPATSPMPIFRYTFNKMIERLVSVEPSTRHNKKYKATVKSIKTGKTRIIHFGDSRYPQYKDSTPSGRYAKKNHNDKARRQRYFMRHSGTTSKTKAIQIERKSGKYSAKLLSHMYLW